VLQTFSITSIDIRYRGIDGREGSVNMNMMIFVATMCFVPLGLVTLYLYVSGVFSKHA
jgi:hypothetical protein